MGLVHIYCGDGKGKTTASMGLALRMAGFGRKVLISQFFKNGSSSELKPLRELENVTMMHCKTVPGRFVNLTAEQRMQAKTDYSNLLVSVLEKAPEYDLLVLDEVISTYNHEAIDRNTLVDFLRNKPEHLEVVLTGRNPAPELLELADYVTEMKKIKHPFDKGIMARKGIEF